MTDHAGTGEADPAGSGPVSAEPSVLLRRRFTEADVTALRASVTATVAAAGLSGDPAHDFVVAVHELVTNAVRHGGGAGQIDMRLLADVLVCEVTDHGGRPTELPVHPAPGDQPGGRGLWLAHRLTGSLMLTRRPDGVTASVSVCVTRSPADPHPGRLPTPGPEASTGDHEQR
jgi:serine/threonine-protein kinase RsbW